MYVSEAKVPVVNGVMDPVVDPVIVGPGVRVIGLRVGSVAELVGEVVTGKNAVGAGAPTVSGDTVLVAAL